MPMESVTISGRAPAPTTLTGWSCPAIVTGTPLGRPVRAAAARVTVPTGDPARTTGAQSTVTPARETRSSS